MMRRFAFVAALLVGCGDSEETTPAAASPSSAASTSGSGGSGASGGAPPLCGNAVVDAGEDCDGEDLAARTCASEGFAYSHDLACDASCALNTSACKTSLVWARRFGGGFEDVARELVVDAAGNVYVAGSVWGPVDFGGGLTTEHGMRDAFLLKLDPQGNHLFSRRFGDSSMDIAWDLAVDDVGGRVAICGFFDGTINPGGTPLTSEAGDGFIVVYSLSGQHLFSRRIGGTGDDYCTGLSFQPNGSLVAFGFSTGGVVDLGNGPITITDTEIFMLTLSSSGAFLQASWFGGPGDQFVESGVGRVGGDLVVSGGYHGGLDVGLGSNGGDGIFVARLAATGAPVYQRVFTTLMPNDAYVYDLDVRPSGNVLLVGSLRPGVDIGNGPEMFDNDDFVGGFALELGPTGSNVWARLLQTMPDGNANWAAAVGVLPDGRALVGGGFLTEADFGGGVMAAVGDRPLDAFWSELGTMGATVYTQRFGGVEPMDLGQESADGMAVDSSGNVIVAGGFYGVADIQRTELMSAGENDIFVIKYAR